VTAAGIAILLLSIATVVLLVVVLVQWFGGRSGRSRENVRDLMRQMNRLAEDIDRRMGGALADMQSMIAQADARIDTLAEALDRGEQTPPDAADSPADDAEAPSQDAEPAHENTDDEQPPAATEPVDPAPTPSVSEAHREVLTLSRDGLTPAEIAQRLDRPVGEVDLILRLHGAPTAESHPQQQAG